MKFLFKLLTPLSFFIFLANFKSYRRSFLSDLRIRFSGFCFGDPTESVSYYHHFHHIVIQNLQSKSKLNVLDLGSPKYLPITLSAVHSVDSVVLCNPSDNFSSVNYIVGNFNSINLVPNNYDCFVSPVTINLLGLGRYGEKVDFNAIPNAVDSVFSYLKPGGLCFLCMTLGNNYVAFNNGVYLSHDRLIQLFSKFEYIESIILDHYKSIFFSYQVVYYCFMKPNA